MIKNAILSVLFVLLCCSFASAGYDSDIRASELRANAKIVVLQNRVDRLEKEAGLEPVDYDEIYREVEAVIAKSIEKSESRRNNMLFWGALLLIVSLLGSLAVNF